MSGTLLGLDIGTTSIKAALIDSETGQLLAQATSPETELEISVRHPGWAEQSPDLWWEHVTLAISALKKSLHDAPGNRAKGGFQDLKAVGIAYQMHGLVLVDADLKPLRPAILWCDSRAVKFGEKAFELIGKSECLARVGNSPGNFTAAKLAWVKNEEPEIYAKVKYLLLPGDYIALKLTGTPSTSRGGLSEGIMWDFRDQQPAGVVMEALGIDPSFIPAINPNFFISGTVRSEVAENLGLPAGVPVTYRAGDQPNNALALNVLCPGEIAANAGTSGVIYGVSNLLGVDMQSRVNNFLHVNHTPEAARIGMLLCINGTGSLNRWLKSHFCGQLDYTAMNALAQTAPIGSRGLVVLPYGNGAERTLGNLNIGASVHGLELNVHTSSDVFRAAQEGIVFALNYGLEIMRSMGLATPSCIRAADANMFKSRVFGETFASTTGAPVELYHTDGAEGAARGAGIGLGIYSYENAFIGLTKKSVIEPASSCKDQLAEAYLRWKSVLVNQLSLFGA